VPLNPELKGKEYERVEFIADPVHVVRFADAIGEDDPTFREAEAARNHGHPGQLAPPTFVTTMQIMASAQVVLDSDLDLDYSRVVHGEQEYEWARPIRAGEALRATPRIADIYSKGPNEYLVIESEIRDESGETVVLARSTLLSRGTAKR
jgi:acyl dehydratase